MLDPKMILDFINIWCENPKTPLDTLNILPGPHHMIVDFIGSERYRIDQARQVKKQIYKKQGEFKKRMNVASVEEFAACKEEIRHLDEDFSKRADFCFKAGDRL